MKQSGFSKSVLALGCLGLMFIGGGLLSGCGGGGETTQKEEKKVAPMKMEVLQVDQLSSLGDKTPDGQYLVAKVTMKNMSNKTIDMDFPNFKLENITDKEEERYSQPAERQMGRYFKQTYGPELLDKLFDVGTTSLYPRMQLERYFVFMVPSDAKIDGYQITYGPEKISAPLVVSGITQVNDHRNETSESATE